MIGRTNVLSLGSGGGVTVVDLPTHPESISTTSNNQKVTISLTYSDTDYISGVEVRYKTNGYPTSPTDGEGITAEGAAESIEISGLTNSLKYYLRVYLYREIGGVKYYQTDDTNATASGIPSVVGIDGITPVIVANDYLVIDTSGSFTMTVPDGLSVTACLVGGGCNGADGGTGSTYDDGDDYPGKGGVGGYSGRYLAQTLSVSGSVDCTLTIGSRSASYSKPSETSFVVGSETYSTASGTYRKGGQGDSNQSVSGWSKTGIDGWQTPLGWVCSSGGGGAYGSWYDSKTEETIYRKGYEGGTGAGKGGDVTRYSDRKTRNGSDAENYGCGGGGGAGGCYNGHYGGYGGAGKQGCIIIAWN